MMRDVIYTCATAVILLLIISVGRYGLFPSMAGDQIAYSIASRSAAVESSEQVDIRDSATDVASGAVLDIANNGADSNRLSRVDVVKHVSDSVAAEVQPEFKQPQTLEKASPPKRDSYARPDSEEFTPSSLLKRLQGISDYQ